MGLRGPIDILTARSEGPSQDGSGTGLDRSGQVWIQLVRRSNGQSALAPYISLQQPYWVILVTQDEPGRVLS